MRGVEEFGNPSWYVTLPERPSSCARRFSDSQYAASRESGEPKNDAESATPRSFRMLSASRSTSGFFDGANRARNSMERSVRTPSGLKTVRSTPTGMSTVFLYRAVYEDFDVQNTLVDTATAIPVRNEPA